MHSILTASCADDDDDGAGTKDRSTVAMILAGRLTSPSPVDTLISDGKSDCALATVNRAVKAKSLSIVHPDLDS